MKKTKLVPLIGLAAMGLIACGRTPVSPTSSGGSSAPSAPSSDPSVPSTPSSDPSVPSSHEPAPLANGVFNYNGRLNVEQTSEAIALLEKYGMDNHITGIPTVDDGGLAIKNERVTFPTSKYVVNYGFGAGRGSISAPLTSEQEPVEGWRNYFHSWTSSDEGTFNDLDDTGSASSSLRAMVSASMYDIRLTADKENYEWYCDLAVKDPIPLNADGEEDPSIASGKRWRFYVHTGGDYVYNTLSSKYSAFAGRAIALEDYVTPIKNMCDYGWYRKNDMSLEYDGIAEYLEVIADEEATEEEKAAAWANVGYKTGSNAEGDYIDVKFENELNAYNARYHINGTLTSPYPQDFVDAVGVDNFFKIGTDTSNFYNNVENILSTGIYCPEYWESGKSIVFKKNTRYWDAESFHYDGYKMTVIQGSGASATAFALWEAGKIDYTGIPATKIQDYKEDPRALKIPGSLTQALQVNSCNEEEYEKYYGENGIVKAHTAGTNTYKLKPILSNDDFLDGIYFSFNREEWADYDGCSPAQAFLGDSYIVDVESNLQYRKTDAAKAVIADRCPETNGYNEDLAAQLFKKAAEDEIAAGHYQVGDTITLTIEWRTEGEMDLYKGFFKGWIEDAWAKANTGINLVINNLNPSTDYTVAYYDLMEGEADFMFGAIEGSALDPLGFMDTLCSDGRNLTLSHGEDTSLVSGDLEFDGKNWSYDALWEATQGPTIVVDGQEAPAVYGLNDDDVASFDYATKELTLKFGYVVSDSITDFAINQVYVDMYDQTGGYVYDMEGYIFPNYRGSGVDLIGIDCGIDGVYTDMYAASAATSLSFDPENCVMTFKADLSAYVADENFDLEKGYAVWFNVSWSAVAAGETVSGSVKYAAWYAPAFFGAPAEAAE